jgi:hypothetical protein
VRKYLVILSSLCAIAASASFAHASNVGFNIGVNVGIPAPVIAEPPVEVVEPPEFVAQPGSGFYVAVGTPYDIFYAGNRYYLCRGDAWYAAPYYNGPWVSVGYRTVPWRLRRYPMARVHSFRDDWGRHRGEGHYAGYGHFRPERHGGGEGRRHGGMMEH